MIRKTIPATVLITGASTGIGAACARRLAARGIAVFAGVRNTADGAALQAKNPDMITPLLIEVTDDTSIAAAVATVSTRVGLSGLGGLLNNAGIAIGGPLEVLPLQEIRRQFEVNLFGAIAVTQAFLPLLRAARGRIVNMGSIAGRVALPIIGPYSMSKAALRSMTASLRLELDSAGIDVSIVEPGAIATPIWKKSTDTADAMSAALDAVALSRYAEHIDCIGRVIAEAEQHAIDADTVAIAVEHALTARRPKPHYLVGTDAKFRAALAAVLPQNALDGLHRWFLKFPKRC
jgi:NAD(P)-dependent dehydrogenase (short-subunit alcohol dehydrogenase family)